MEIVIADVLVKFRKAVETNDKLYLNSFKCECSFDSMLSLKVHIERVHGAPFDDIVDYVTPNPSLAATASGRVANNGVNNDITLLAASLQNTLSSMKVLPKQMSEQEIQETIVSLENNLTIAGIIEGKDGSIHEKHFFDMKKYISQLLGLERYSEARTENAVLFSTVQKTHWDQWKVVFGDLQGINNYVDCISNVLKVDMRPNVDPHNIAIAIRDALLKVIPFQQKVRGKMVPFVDDFLPHLVWMMLTKARLIVTSSETLKKMLDI